MRKKNQIAIIENRKRIAVLAGFRKDVVDYFNNTEPDYTGLNLSENDNAHALRTKINLQQNKIHNIIIASGISPTIIWTPPPMIGGYRSNLDVIENIFSLSRYQVPPNAVLDFLEKSTGIYIDNERMALFRTFNPFYYFGLLLHYFSETPFYLVEIAGFNSEKIENTFFGKCVRLILYLSGGIASILTILQLLGYLGQFKELLNNILGI